MVSAFAPLAAAPPRPDNSPSNPRGGQRGGLDGKGEEGAVSAHPRPGTQGWVGQSRDFSLAFSRRFVKAAKVVRPRVRGMKGEERVVDGRWWKGKARVLGTRRGMCRLTTPFESVDGCFDSSAAIPAGYETDLLRLREKEEKGTKR